MAETFTERFNRLTASLSDTDLQVILELSYGSVQRLKTGGTQSIKLDAGLRLAKRLDISPYALAGEPEPAHHLDVEIDEVRLAIYAPVVAGDPSVARTVRHALADAMRAIGADVRIRNDGDVTQPVSGETESADPEESPYVRRLAAELEEVRSQISALVLRLDERLAQAADDTPSRPAPPARKKKAS